MPRTSDPITNKYFDIADRVTGNVSGSGYRSGNMVNNGSMSNMGYAGNMGTGNMGTVPMGARDRNIDALL